MTYLLDVNVLVALIDPAHVAHEDAHDWFARIGHRNWSTCPLTQNGVIRIVGHSRYPSTPGSPAAVAEIMKRLCGLPGHAFWPDDLSLVASDRIDPERLLTSAQVTDTYLLAMAAERQGKLATFDHRLSPSAVRDGATALHVIGVEA